VNNKLLILGGGFGLYGYLPAAMQTYWQVTTLSRYKRFLEDRIELSGLLNRVNFVEENDIELNIYDAVVIARTPQQQIDFVRSNTSFDGHLFLEKPLGNTVKSTSELLDVLQSRKSNFSLAYLFQYQDWYKAIASEKQSECSVTINWRITPSRNQNWKKQIDAGGGILSYYGVHLLSLIVDCEYDLQSLQINYGDDSLGIRSKNSSSQLDIKLTVDDRAGFEINLKGLTGSYHWSGASPFGINPTPDIPDPRIPALVEYLSGWQTHKDLTEAIAQERKILRLRQTISEIL
jgi:hypothetical protein